MTSKRAGSVLFLLAALGGTLAACGSESLPLPTITVTPDASAPVVDPFTVAPKFGVACQELTARVPNPAREHVPVEVALEYTTKPPCAGAHYPLWAAFAEYDKPVPYGYIVHSLEHGAVVLSYKCATRAECPELASALREIGAAAPDDPLCAAVGSRARVIVLPDPNLDRQIGVAVWGTSLAADCADPEVLKPFVRANYAVSPPENTCSPGFSTF